MEIKSTECVYRGMGGKRCWLAMQQSTFIDDKGKEHGYFFVTRGDKVVPAEEKKPDAVVIIAFSENCDAMLLTKEYRLPIGRYEIGSAAGLIDAKDYEGTNSVAEAAIKAAIREVHEETGLDFTPVEVSPDNMYCSAGMTDESVCMVIGKVSGKISKEFLEEHEDITAEFADRERILELMSDSKMAFSKHVWPFMWMVKTFGFPELVP